MVLPFAKTPPTSVNPKYLLIYGAPKTGKSSAMAMLDNCFCIDLKDEYAHLNAIKQKIGNLQELGELINLIKKHIREEGKPPYKYIAIDNATYLEELVLPLASTLYKNSPLGKNWKGEDVLELPNGAGYGYLRKAFNKVLDSIKELTPHLILICHIKQSAVDVEGEELQIATIDLPGKLSRIVAADADAIARMYRKGNKTVLDFNGTDKYTAQARAEHLRGQVIELLESDEKGKITAHWDRIFLNKEQQIKQAA